MLVMINNLGGNIRSIDKCLTILIFDSGVGGLSIYQELRFLLPDIFYIYFFDNKFFPYGERSDMFILDRVVNIFRVICQLHRVDLAVIACNTVTVVLVEKIRNYFSFPIIGIVPDIQLGMRYTRNGIIGLLATYRTINSKFILNIVNKLSSKMYCILLLNMTELVQFAEDKILSNKEVSVALLYELLSPWLSVSRRPDTIILGCTHFLHLRNELDMVFQNRVCLVGSAKVLANHIAFFIVKSGMYRKNITKNRLYQAYCSCITDTILIRWLLVLRNYGFLSLKQISV